MGAVLSGVTAMRSPCTAAEPARRYVANPAGRSKSGVGPAATAPAFWAAVSVTITVSLKLSGPGPGTDAPSSFTSTPAPRRTAPVVFVSFRYASPLNSTSSTPVFRSSLTGDGTVARSSGVSGMTMTKNPKGCGGASRSGSGIGGGGAATTSRPPSSSGPCPDPFAGAGGASPRPAGSAARACPVPACPPWLEPEPAPVPG